MLLWFRVMTAHKRRRGEGLLNVLVPTEAETEAGSLSCQSTLPVKKALIWDMYYVAGRVHDYVNSTSSALQIKRSLRLG